VLTTLTFQRVSAGGSQTCAETTDHRAYCWGRNLQGALGDGTTTQRLTPVAVIGGLHFMEVSAGGFTTCGIARSGGTYCWGSNSSGEVGDGTGMLRRQPTLIAGGG
jgi:alpha-tubulin suppressor-like RCC1 family protein